LIEFPDFFPNTIVVSEANDARIEEVSRFPEGGLVTPECVDSSTICDVIEAIVTFGIGLHKPSVGARSLRGLQEGRCIRILRLQDISQNP
jgi:hypothetical protein